MIGWVELGVSLLIVSCWCSSGVSRLKSALRASNRPSPSRNRPIQNWT